MRCWWAIAWLLAVLVLLSCGQRDSSRRVLVLALDGLDPDAVALLSSEGKLPNFARLEREGASGRLLSERPLLSPVVWTTIATGKTPDRHGIGHFVAVNPRTGEELPVTSRMRRTKAIWNIASEAGREVAVVGWWATWPPERVRGAVVSDHAAYHFLFPKALAGDLEAAPVTYPEDLEKEIAPLLRGPKDMTAAELAPFVTVRPEDLARPFDFNDELAHFRWALASAESYGDIGLKLWRDDRPDLELVYIEGTDTVSHLFGHLFRAEGLAGDLAEQQERYGLAVERMYEYADRLVGDYLAAMDDRTTLVVLSDHGFDLGALPDDPSRIHDLRRVSEQAHRMEGVLYLYGDGIRPGSRIDGPRILDVMPTLLRLQGLAAAKDMPGRVLSEALSFTVSEERIATYETGRGEAKDRPAGTGSDRAQLEHLRSLGYLGARSPAGDRSMAATLYRQGRTEEAATLYRKLVEEEPKDASLRTSLAGVLGKLGRYEEAREQLEAGLNLDPLSPEGHHNLAVIHERSGEEKLAVEEYRNTLRCDPRYEPARQALLRLTGSAEPDPPRNAAEAKAAELAEQASEAARRGDYNGALALLDKAVRIAPRFARVYQFRSNVAWLMGDVPGAMAALEKAVAIEPRNVLYRENLRRLRKQARPSLLGE